MKNFLKFLACALSALGLVFLSFQATADGSVAPSTKGMDDTLVIVDKIIGVDAMGKQQVLYDEDDGRVYRLDNIEQSIHDLNARGIESKGTFRSLRAVLSDTVYVFGQSSNPSPVARKETSIPEVVALSVDRLHVTKDRVTAIYTTNCDNNPI